MSDLRIDYSDLTGLVDEGARQTEEKKERRARVRTLPLRTARSAAVMLGLALLPFAILIRGGVFAYREWGVGTWPALALAIIATALLLGGYAWYLTRRVGAGPRVRRLVTRVAMGVGIAYACWALVFIASENVKSEAVQAEYARVHPLLRIAASALILVDPAAVITDAGRTREDYFLMGLPPNEASLHFEQETGFVHALDLRTRGRPEWRNRAVEMAFWALGFHSLRHVGTADHLHLSLRLPA
jgi:hypothetical protein